MKAKKPIATVQWTAVGIERTKDFMNNAELDRFTAILDFKKFSYVVFMRSLRANVHFKREKRPFRHTS